MHTYIAAKPLMDMTYLPTFANPYCNIVSLNIFMQKVREYTAQF